MIKELDNKLVRKFRSFVNSNNSYVRIYTTRNIEANTWSKICSCMDWLDVAIEGIKKPGISHNMNANSLEFAHFLIDIDMIIESVENLWMAFSSSFKDIKGYKYNSNEIFNAREFGKDYTDREYFKEVRAWFGIHAVNGNERNLPDFKKTVRFFSSWSSSNVEGEYTLILYSNNNRAEELYGGIKKVYVKDLINIARVYYCSLYQLIDEVQKSYEFEIKNLQSKKIYIDDGLSSLEKLKRLRSEALNRNITSEFYEDDIKRYIEFLKVDIAVYDKEDRQIVLDYLTSLSPIIVKYHDLIENLNVDSEDIFKLMRLKSNWFRENHYAISKSLEKKEYPALSEFSYSLEIQLLKESGLSEYIDELNGYDFSLLIYAYDYKFFNERLS